MEPWKLVLDESAFHFFIARPPGERRSLLVGLERLRNDPHRKPDYYSTDATGRKLSVWAIRPYMITYWLDVFVSEVRIVNIQKIRF